MTVYYFHEDIRNVTSVYYSILVEALYKSHNKCVLLNKCSWKTVLSIPRSDYILVTTLSSFFLLFITGHRHFIYWYQGVSPEENFQIFKSKWRYTVYSFIEKISLKVSEYKIGVSSFLFDHFEEKYNLLIDRKDVFIMPCFNSELKEESFRYPNKYSKNIFCYAGGIQVWQGFKEILNIYSKIEQSFQDVYLKVYSKDISSAEIMIKEAHINRYSLACVPQDRIESELADCKFGFIIRDNNVINNVATPTKMGTYLANGVIPIFSDTIKSFQVLSDRYNYLCCVNENNVIERINEFMLKDIDIDQMLDEYREIFLGYYNKERFINELSVFFS